MKAQEAHKARRVFQETTVSPAFKALKALLALKVIRVRRVTRAIPAKEGLKAIPASPAQRVSLVPRVTQVKTEPRLQYSAFFQAWKLLSRPTQPAQRVTPMQSVQVTAT